MLITRGRMIPFHLRPKLCHIHFSSGLQSSGVRRRFSTILGTTNNFTWDDSSISQKIEELATSGCIRDVIFILENMKDRGMTSHRTHFHLALASSIKFKQFDSVEMIIESMNKKKIPLPIELGNDLMIELTKAKQWNRALSIFERMTVVTNTTTSTHRTTLDTVLLACGASGQLSILEQVLSQWQISAVDHFETIIAALQVCKDVDKDKELLSEMSSMVKRWNTVLADRNTTSAASYILQIKMHSFGGRPSSAMALLDEMKAGDMPRTREVYEAVVAACAGEGQWWHARQLIYAAQAEDALTPSEGMFLDAVGACWGVGDPLKGAEGTISGDTSTNSHEGKYKNDSNPSLGIIADMEAMGLCLKGGVFEAAIVATSLHGNGSIDQGLELLTEMHRRGMQPSNDIVGRVMGECNRCGRHQEALHLFEGLLFAHTDLTSTTHAIAALCALGHWDDGLDLFCMTMDGLGCDQQMFLDVLATFEAVGARYHAMRVKDAMGIAHTGEAPAGSPGPPATAPGEMGNPPAPHSIQVFGDDQEMLFKSLLKAYNVRSIWARELLAFHDELEASEETMNTPRGIALSRKFNKLLKHLGIDGRLSTVLKTFMNNKAVGWGVEAAVVTRNALIQALAFGGEWEAASGAFDEMRALGLPPNIETYNSLIMAFGEGGEWEKAVETFRDIEYTALSPDTKTYNALIHALNCGDQWNRALRAFARMRQNGLKPDVMTYNVLISTYGHQQKWDQVWETFEELKAEGLDPSGSYRNMMRLFAMGKRWDDAWVVFEAAVENEKDPSRLSKYTALIRALGDAGYWEKAEEAFRMLCGTGYKPDTYCLNYLMRAYANGGQWKKMVRAFGKLKRSNLVDHRTYQELINRCRADLPHTGSMELHNEAAFCLAMLQLVKHLYLPDLRGGYSDGEEYVPSRCYHELEQCKQLVVAMMARCVRFGESETALKIFDAIQFELPRTVAMYDVAVEAHNQLGQWANAEKLTEELNSLDMEGMASSSKAEILYSKEVVRERSLSSLVAQSGNFVWRFEEQHQYRQQRLQRRYIYAANGRRASPVASASSRSSGLAALLSDITAKTTTSKR